MLGFNALSSFMVGFLQLNDPPMGIRLVVSVFAIINSLIGWWLTVRLWRETDPSRSVEEGSSGVLQTRGSTEP